MVRKARDEAEAEVHASRDRYAALAAEREVLLREVNHRVGNSLQIIASLLHLQANSSSQDDVKAALTNAMGRVAAVAQVHRRLYTSHDLKSVLLNQYLEALLEDLQAVGRRQQDVAADPEGRTGRDRPRSRGGDRHHRQRTGDERREIRLPRRRRPDPRHPRRRRRRSRTGDCRRRRRPQRQDRPALHRHGTAHRLRDGLEARSQRRARSRPCRHPDRAAVSPRQQAGGDQAGERGGGLARRPERLACCTLSAHEPGATGRNRDDGRRAICRFLPATSTHRYAFHQPVPAHAPLAAGPARPHAACGMPAIAPGPPLLSSVP